MFRQKIIAIIAIAVFTMSATGCSVVGGKGEVDDAERIFEQGNAAQAIRKTKSWLNFNPRNFWAKRLLKKIEKQLIEEGRLAIEAGKYKEADAKVSLALKVNSKSPEALAIRKDAKKQLLLQAAKKNLAADNPVGALRSIKGALKLDPNFQEAKDLQAQAKQQVEKKIADLMDAAQELFDKGEFEKLRKLSQDILTIAPQNVEVSGWLRKAQAAILEKDKAKNLALAKRFFEEGIYESAKKKAEKVLKVDPGNRDAKRLVEASNDEITKPKLKLVAFTKIKGMEIATIWVESTGERFMVKEGDVFADFFKVSAIDYDLKAAVVMYTKTRSQQTLTLGEE